MEYILRGHGNKNDVYTIIQLFYPNENYVQVEDVSQQGIVTVSHLEAGVCSAEIYQNGELAASCEKSVAGLNEKQIKNAIKSTVFHCLAKLCGFAPPWGILTGIRPTKKALELMKSGITADIAQEMFVNDFLVQPEKAALCVETARKESRLIASSETSDVALYIGIPFCPTRCLYCSFTSYPIEKYRSKTGAYLSALHKELAFIAEQIVRKDQRLESVYIGGGTPTTLDEGELETLLRFITMNFDLSSLKEFCIEAGRPDTISAEKLEIMRKYNVGRISVNPQTMKQKTLELIGRKHTPEEFMSAYETAKSLGFSINIDIILGLPEEGVSDVKNTLETLLALAPDSLTAHTLCVKRASDLNENLGAYRLSEAETLKEMTALSYDLCKQNGLQPYYLYRQKNALGNYENVGYAKEGHECLYNVQIMQEKQTIYAAGAGSVTKLFYPGENRIERSFNVKNVDDYINRIDEMLSRKLGLL